MKRLAVLVIVLSCCFGILSADAVKLKNGKIYKGFIMYYENGTYTVLVKGKKYPVPEDSVAAIKWDASEDEILAAYAGEPVSKKKNRGYETGSLVKFVMDFIATGDAEAASIAGGLQVYPGVEYAWIMGPAKFGVQLNLGFTSGEGPYTFETDPDGFKTGTYEIGRSVFILMLTNTTSFDIFGDSPIKLFLGAGIGGGISLDSLKNYPAIIDYYSAAVYEDKQEMSPVLLVEGKLGLAYSVSDKIILSFFGGYRAVSGSAYGHIKSDYDYYGTPGIFELMEKAKNFGGIIFGLDCSYVF